MDRRSEWMSTGQVARAFGVCRQTVLDWIEKKVLPGQQATPGGHWRIPREAVHRLLGKEDA